MCILYIDYLDNLSIYNFFPLNSCILRPPSEQWQSVRGGQGFSNCSGNHKRVLRGLWNIIIKRIINYFIIISSFVFFF